MIPSFIQGLHDETLRQKMEVWRQDYRPKVNKLSIVILMALQKDAIERDDIVDFETISDSESDSEPAPEPSSEVGEFGPRSRIFKQEDIKAVGEILRKIYRWWNSQMLQFLKE